MPVKIDEETLSYVRKIFSKLQDKVTLYFFVDKESECPYCGDTEEILRILSSLSDKISVEKREKGSEEAKNYKIPLFPAILIHGKDEYNVRYFGVPAGYEFGVLIEDIVDVSSGSVSIDPYLQDLITKIDREVRIMVFVSPTCPYCPIAARASHRFAILNKNIYGDVIEAVEFPELANKYTVYAVPKSVIQVEGEDRAYVEGAIPDAFFVAKLLEALGEEIPEKLSKFSHIH